MPAENFTYTLEKRHISMIRPGDTVAHDGKLMTVCPKNLTHDSFLGYALFGDSYRGGHRPVEVAIFKQPRVPLRAVRS